ncbi:MAG: patatin-like phospholipase family protein [Acidovorax sp.]
MTNAREQAPQASSGSTEKSSNVSGITPISGSGKPAVVPSGAAPATASPSAIKTMVAQRRRALSGELAERSSDGTWGLALSGGGIRSATFCFGLLKALAQNRVLHRFDILSTVSGGGYIGSMLGKFCQNANIGQVEEALSTADKRWFAFWLRANGRYLIPHGLKDALFACANFGRNLLGIHIEIAIISLLLGGLLVGFDLIVWLMGEAVLGSVGSPPGMVVLFAQWPTLWIFLPPVVFASGVVAAAYWCLPDEGSALPGFRWVVAVCSLAVASGIAWNVFNALRDLSQSVSSVTLSLIVVGGSLLALFIGSVVAKVMAVQTATLELARNRLTAALAATAQIGLAIAVLGLADLCAWQLAVASSNPAGTAGGIALTIVVLRALLPQIGDLPRGLSPLSRMLLAELMNLAGLGAMLALVVFWMSLVHRSVTLPLFDSQSGLRWTISFLWLGVIELLPLIFMLISRGNRGFLNRSSLFAFYRARLVRSYLGATNRDRFRDAQGGPLGQYPAMAATGGNFKSVREVSGGDDLNMTSYAPYEKGGPVHLLNVCINQTQDVEHGLFNTDRKGLSMTVGPRCHVCVGQERWYQLEGQSGGLTLGAWTAISGAAVAPGLGATTRPGLAALLTMAGIRLGYWWDSEGLTARKPTGAMIGKYGQLLGELRGSFTGTERRDWYLSDGGHFENTAAYALLREECELIVLADCGADPRYAFGDLENLVRKARIDLQAEITFLRPAARNPSDPSNPPLAFGSLNDLASEDGHACLCLARVDYRRTGATGYIVVVKPNMCAGAPVDLVNFKADNRLFPQEPTTDQFFSEAQWESYFQLGTLLGGHLRSSFLNELTSHASVWFQADDGSISAPVHDSLRSKAEPKRIPSRIAATGAVTASLSLGALATMASSAWQVLDTQLDAMRSNRHIDPALLKELADDFGKIAPTPTDPRASAADAAHLNDAALGKMASNLARINEEVCNDGNKTAFRQSSLMQQIAKTTVELCSSESPKHPSCDRVVTKQPLDSCVMLPSPGAFRCEPHYWVRSYAGTDASANCLNPTTPIPTPDLYTLLDTALPRFGTLLRPRGSRACSWPGATEAELKAAGCAVDWASLGASSAESGVSSGASSTVSSPASTGASPPVSYPASSPASNPVSTPSSAPVSTGASSPTPTVVSSSASAAATRSGSGVCAGQTIYVQIFGPELRDSVQGYRAPWQSLGAKVPLVEDVRDTARRANRAAPRAPTRTTIRYSDDESVPCAEQLAPKGAWEIKKLPPSLAYSPGVIEVWFPPDALPTTGVCYQEKDPAAEPVARYGAYCFINRAQCELVRGPNTKTEQTSCEIVDLRGLEKILQRRGFGGSWYVQQSSGFDAPFPRLSSQGAAAAAQPLTQK